jgi:tetratricopeptide (TPR) repeat protein
MVARVDEVRPIDRLDACALPPPPRRWGWIVPTGALVALVALRPLERRPQTGPVATDLYERASRAYAGERFADAAEYARNALALHAPVPAPGELLSLRGEAAFAAGDARAAAEAFEALLGLDPRGPYAPQALFGAARARTALGERGPASGHRDRLLREFADTPWARRMRTESGPNP